MKGDIRVGNSMLYAIFLDIKLEDLYLPNSIATMPMFLGTSAVTS